MAKKQVIRLTEGDLHNIIKESVKNVLKEARKPEDAYFGGYFFEGIGFDRNGNPIYYSEHLPVEVMDMLGWKKSTKWGRCGQATNWAIRNALEKLGLPYGNDEEEYYNALTEGRKTQKARTGTIEMNGEHIRATEDGLDKYGNPMYKVKHPSIKGRKTKDGYTRVQHFNFKPDRVNESIYEENNYNGPYEILEVVYDDIIKYLSRKFGKNAIVNNEKPDLIEVFLGNFGEDYNEGFRINFETAQFN